MSTVIKIEIDGREVLNQKIEEPKSIELGSHSQYARFFDETTRYWDENYTPEMKLFFLNRMQDHANEILKSRYKSSIEKVGHLYLNEVYDMLGMPRTVEGQLVGWIYSDSNPIGDNYVDFGIYNIDQNTAFVNGFKNSVLLDFNVDGVIIDRIRL